MGSGVPPRELLGLKQTNKQVEYINHCLALALGFLYGIMVKLGQSLRAPTTSKEAQ